MKFCPQCQSTDVPDCEPVCIYCSYRFEDETSKKSADSEKEKPIHVQQPKMKPESAKENQQTVSETQDDTITVTFESTNAIEENAGPKVPPPYIPPAPKEKTTKTSKPPQKNSSTKKKGKAPIVIAFVILFFVILIVAAGFSIRYLNNIGVFDELFGTKEKYPGQSSFTSNNSLTAETAKGSDVWSGSNAIASELIDEEGSEVNSYAGEENAEPEEENSENGVSEIPFEDQYMIPGSDIRYVTMEDVAGFSKEEVRIAINELYARHGRMFRSEELQEYFDAKSWDEPIYTPDDWQEEWLTDVECYNRDFLVNYRNSL